MSHGPLTYDCQHKVEDYLLATQHCFHMFYCNFFSHVLTCFDMSFLFQRQISALLRNLTSPMAAWDPFLDPADDGPQDLKVELDRHSDPVLKDVPLDPWNDSTFVALAQEAAREAEERYEAAMKVLEIQQEAERKESEAKEARRLKLEKEAREIAKLSIQEPYRSYRITLGYCWEALGGWV